MDAIAELDRMDDDYGLDTIEMGATIGVAMEAGLAQFGDARITSYNVCYTKLLRYPLLSKLWIKFSSAS